MLLRWRPSIRQHPCQGWHKSWSIGWMPNVLSELLGAGRSRNKWLLMKYSVCPVTACIIAYYDKLCWWCIHYFTLLHIITFDIFACYYMLLQWSLLHCYYIFLHCYYLLLHLSLLPVITNSLLHIITLLLPHYYIIITSLCNLENSCNNGFIITYYYIGLFHYYIIITHYVIISHYYLLLTGQLADESVGLHWSLILKLNVMDDISEPIATDSTRSLESNGAGLESQLGDDPPLSAGPAGLAGAA